MNSKSNFFNVPRTTYKTSEGNVELPILYYDNSAVVLYFLSDMNSIMPLLKNTGLQPYKFPGNKALTAIALFEYRKTSIGTYNEAGVGIVVSHKPNPSSLSIPFQFLKRTQKRNFSFYVVDLAVTTSAAYTAGVELWGYPKFITEIPFELSSKSLNCQVLDPKTQKPIFTVHGYLGPGIIFPAMDISTYTHHNNSILKTDITIKSNYKNHRGRSIEVNVGKSGHRMANNVMEMGLDRAQPLLVQATNKFQSILPPGVPVAEWPHGC